MTSFTRPRRRTRLRAAAAGLALALGLTACSNGDGGLDQNISDDEQIVIGAEQEPDCADWIATCAANIWGSYTMRIPTLPRAFESRKNDGSWELVPSDLLTGEPSVAITDDGKQTITYRINPEAQWSDGEPITGEDFVYTGLQIRDGDDIFDKSGYSLIESIDAPNERTAVVTLKTSTGSWKKLFSGDYSVLPSHILKGEDRAEVMKDGYDFSGGPWKIESWVKGVSVTLVPNDNYWGEKPKLKKVTFQFITDTAAAFLALKSGQVQALYPTPQLDAMSQIKAGVPNTNIDVDTDSGNLEALWINNAAFPFDSKAVRQAFAYSIDRPAIVERLYGQIGVEQVQQSFLTPLNGIYAREDFSRYTKDLEKVDELMTDDGWRRNGEGIWEKNGKPAEFRITTQSGNQRRELAEQILQKQAGEAGFSMKIANVAGADLFSSVAPEGDFEVGMWTIIDTVPEPDLGSSFRSDAIPGEDNGFSGINFTRAKISGADGLLNTVARTTNDKERIKKSHAAEKLIAEAVPGIPIDTVPNIVMTSDRVEGPVEINPAEGPFWNLEEWTLD
ncbi:ABC transporter substrate-binding protein [Brevibacterium marinum]|uniref:Peptide/nickel transport system substrate-binding protein n=1 Tax=Brevibacterium marinum TaxID=418643 RepID=A0A846RPV6_9MICO|nr:ABC transporter substrate-binding protein [Brevibacterium marinum]NJC55769.1 peptide/nickel transport system substrate-binding protein [Brevibacterium marinum]